MNELQEMQNEIAQMKEETHNRMAQLEQENMALKTKSKAQAMRQQFVLGLAVIGVGLTFMTYKGNTQSTEFGTVICNQIKVIDGNRNTVVWISPTKDGEGAISTFNGARKRIVNISATSSTGEGSIELGDGDHWIARLQSFNRKGVLYLAK